MPSKNIIHVARSYLIVLVGAGGARALAFLTSIVLARTLGAESFGHFSLFQSTMFIFWQIPQAFDTSFIRYAKSEDSGEHIRDCLAAATKLKLIFAILAALAAYPIGLTVDHFKPGDNLGILVAGGIVCGSFLCFLNSIANLMRVREQFGRFSMVQGLYNFALCLVIVIMAYVLRNITIQNALATVFCLAIVFGLGSFVLVTRSTGNPFKAPSELVRLIFSLAKWLLPMMVAFYLFARIDILMLSALVPFEQVGVYSAAGQVILIVTLIISSASTVFMPRSIQAIKSRQGVKNYVKEAIAPICMILASILLLFISAPLLFKVLFTSEYAGSVEILRVLLIGYFFVGLYSPISFLFYALDKPDLKFYLEAFKLLTAVSIMYFTIPRWGAIGAAGGMSAAMIVNSIISTTILFRLLKKVPVANSDLEHQGAKL